MTFLNKKVSVKYSQKHLNHGKESATDPLKSVSKRAIKKTVEIIGDLIGNKTTKTASRNALETPK